MGLFGRNTFGGSLFDKGPSIVEKVDMLFKNVKIEGKKKGYERAAKEYTKAFKAIEDEYKATKELIEKQKNSYESTSEILIFKLENLEKQKKELEKQVKHKAKEVSTRYNIPTCDVTKSLAVGAGFVRGTAIVDILGLIYNHKEKKLREAEQSGYVEARELYEEKIARLKIDLLELKDKGSKEIQELLDMINDLFDAISEEQMKIAELKILL